MDWTEIAALEPALDLERDILAGKTTLTEIMLSFTGGLTPLVGRFAVHPRLRNSEAFGVAYDHLAAIDRQRREARAAAGGIAEEVTA